MLVSPTPNTQVGGSPLSMYTTVYSRYSLLCSIMFGAERTSRFSQQSLLVMYSTELIFQRPVH